MIQTCILLGTLGVHSIEDIREKKITVNITLFSGIIGVFLHLLFQNQSIYEMLAGTLPGVFIFLISYLTKGKIGMGDGMVFMLTGLYLGFGKNMTLMAITFLLAGVFGLYLLIQKETGADKKMPLMPFLFLGYSLMVLSGVRI